MKRLSLYLFLILFTLQTPSQADDIRDFQIEGMSIGYSALDYFSEAEIKKGIQFDYYNDDLYYESQIENKNFNTYEGVSIIFFSDDKNYIIQGLGGYIFMDSTKCLATMNQVKKSMTEVWPNTNSKKYDRYHPADNSKKSRYYHILFEIEDGNAVIECLDWTEEITSSKGWTDNLNLRITKEEFEIWLSEKAFN